MEDDLHLTPNMYSVVASTLIIGYLVFQLPAMLLMRKIGPQVEVSTRDFTYTKRALRMG
jgi:hypothetical protein